MSIYESLRAVRGAPDVYHVHKLCHLDEIEQEVRRSYPNPKYALEEIGRARALRQVIDSAGVDRVWNVVTMVRDPIARHVSAVFELLPGVIPDFRNRYLLGQITIEQIVQRIMSLPEGLTQWYDWQLKPLFGIDVFRFSFPMEKGYKIYENARARLLLIRMEDMNVVARAAFTEFLGMSDFVLGKRNLAEDKSYGEIYPQLQALKLPDDYVESCYDTKFMRHFYSTEEIEQLRIRWTQGR